MATGHNEKRKKSKQKDSVMSLPPCCMLKQTINEATICPVCTERLVSPKLLPCFHTVCLSCLRRRFRGKADGGFGKCPLCNCKFILTGNGVDDIQPDFVAEHLLRAEDKPEMEKQSACESCPVESDGLLVDVPPATSFCMDCTMKLCDGCTRPHSTMRGKNHRVLTLGKQVKWPTPYGQTYENHTDADGLQHPTNVCESCQTSKFDTSQEMCKPISDAVTVFMEQLEGDIESITDAISAVQAEILRLHKLKCSFVDEIEKTEAAIMCKGNEVKKFVDTQVECALETLANVRSKSLEKIAWAVQVNTKCILPMKGFQKFAQLIKCEGTPYIISRVAEELNMHCRATFLLKLHQDAKADVYHTPKVVFAGADIECCQCPNMDKGNLIGKLSVVEHTPPVKGTVLSGEPIAGLTIMKRCLFVLRQQSSEVEVYCMETFKLERRQLVSRGIAQAKDMTADCRHRVLYIADCKKQVIHRVPVTGSHDQDEWSVGQKPTALSISCDSSHLLVSCCDARRLIEFSAQGNVLREINICGVVAFHHAVKLACGQIVASVGCGRPESPVQRVCYLDIDDKNGRGCLASMPGFTLVGPGHLAALVGSEMDEAVLVGDLSGARVVVLTSALTSLRVVACRTSGLHRVWRLCVDCANQRLYVADNIADVGDGSLQSGRVVFLSL